MTVQERITTGEKFNGAHQTGNVITVNFREDTLFAIERDDGIFVAVKPICATLGLAWQRQLERLKEDPVLSEGITTVVIPSPGGVQETTCLKLGLVNGWLFKVDSRRVKNEETRRKLLTYQRECHQVLFEAFFGAPRTAAPDLPEPDETADNENLKLRHVTECRQTFGTAAAAQLWFKLGLPFVPAMRHDPAQITIWDYSKIKDASA